MKILHVINSLGNGGAEKLMADLIPRLKQSSNQIDLLVLTNQNDRYSEELIEKGIRVTFLGSETNLKSYKLFKKMKGYLKNNNYDLVHGHLFPVQYFLPFIIKKPLFFTEHSTTSRRRKSFFVYLEKLIHKKTSRYIFVSRSAKKSFEEFIKEVDNQKNLIVYNGIDIDYIRSIERVDVHTLLNIPFNKKIITMISSFKPEKDQKTVIDAIERNEDYHLIFVGDGDTKTDCVEYVKTRNLINRIHFLGFRKDALSIVKGSDLVVQSSFNEGFGLSALEAMACEIPVLVSNIDGLVEVVDESKYQFYVGDPINLSLKIDEVLSKNQYESAKHYAKMRANEFSIEETAKQYLAAYKEFI